MITPQDRADAIIKDILTNHLPRVREGLEKGYVDENQILVMYDHAVRARIMIEHAKDWDARLPTVEDIQAIYASTAAMGEKI